MTVENQGNFQVGTTEIRRVAMITNPAAGKGEAVHAAQKARQRFSELGIDVVSLQGASAESSLQLAEAAVVDERIDALVVAGGDGLINLALQAQAHTDMPLGIIPAGTGNDHAREYNIPTGDPVRAAEIIADGFWTTTDLGLITEYETNEASEPSGSRWFGTISCAGFDSLVTDRSNALTWPKGKSRYSVAIFAEVLNWKATPTRIVLDHEIELNDPIILCSIGNTRTYGGGMKICPRANHHDGLLDLTIMEDIGRLQALPRFSHILKGTLTPGDGISMYRAKHVRIEMPKMNCYADGDLMATLPIELEAVPGAGRYLVPRP
ncbi:diacylglycerol kinase [Corynebacterium anserum]|uniref:Diacylglycerol kinase n=1 Tax=Corynebacterium anserum TaxID=2684406 RepID=A0A7G7YPX0_9CORY|nr:diacylglycerol kinase [Corynebacterium anserum]MBC2682190.1 diacylglycerol kinase [Corynebacterium anserum]QNH96540.1 diacylglycerol kinase [Corynebacterium anserum]